MTPRIQDFKFSDYIRAAGLGRALQTREIPGGGRVGALYLDQAWLDTKNWFPITNEAATAHDFFGILSREKTDYLYRPETFAALAARAPELTQDAPYERALAFGNQSNHWHFIFDCLPRLVFAFEGGDPNIPLLVGSAHGPRQQSIVTRLYEMRGLQPPPVHVLPDGIAAVRRTLFPGRIDIKSGVALWERLLLPADVRPATRDLFVRRGKVDRRRMLNEDEAAAHFSRKGFEVIDAGQLDFFEQVELFRSARTVIAPHGAALSNIVFAPPGGVLIELVTGVEQPFYAQLAAAKNWRRSVVRDPNPTPASHHHEDFSVPLADIERVLTEAYATFF
jgi:capsular polysaccharide biosynthesis protein